MQLRDQFFQLERGLYVTYPIGNVSLLFLPGTHHLRNELEFRGNRDLALSFELTGHRNESIVENVIISCSSPGTYLYFLNSRVIRAAHLHLRNCPLVAHFNADMFLVDDVIFDSSRLVIRNVNSANITNIFISATATHCNFNGAEGIFHSWRSTMSLRNASFSSENTSMCRYNPTTLLYAHQGHLDIADSVFYVQGKHIRCSNTALKVTGSATFENGNPAIQAQDSIIHLAGNVMFSNGNTAIQTVRSPITLAGNTSFINNTGYQGGALSLSDSHLTVTDNAHVLLLDNHADHVGGAIYSTGNDIANYVSVGARVSACQVSFGSNSSIEFINNTAESGGSAIYGVTASKLVCGVRIYDDHNPYSDLFPIITIQPDDFSAVSSDPLRICVCPDNSTPDCLAILPDQNIAHLHYTVYPGQTFTIPAAVVGFNFAFTSGSVYAQFLNSDAKLGSESQYVQGVTQTGCTQLHYSVLSERRQETLVLTSNGRNVEGIPNNIQADIEAMNTNVIAKNLRRYLYNPARYFSMTTMSFATNRTDGVFRIAGYVPRSLENTPVFISVTLLDCPPGFTLSDQAYTCECNDVIGEHNLTCNINDQTVRRDGTTWINASSSGNSTNGIIVHQHCPFDYCKPEAVNVDLTNPDTQCAFDHSGTLCGACKPNFSLALGSSQCLPNCSRNCLLLLIPFALAGFALVFFIKVLNLTVSQGTINGLIFYANIVAANRSIFFPVERSKLLSFLHGFISWLNLDLGIETCFFKGLDGYWKTWLQFVFPFYLWALAATIIWASHRSTRATRIFGKNSLSVLATLFLVSYSRLLQSTIMIFSFTTLVYSGNFTTLVWAFDGNISYLSHKHIPLFIFALAIMLLLWLPYTAVLLCAKCLRTKTHFRGLHWLKPFLDAYYGPFKDQHHYWVGVLLVARGVLFVFFASFFAVQNNVNLLIISISSISLAAFSGFSVYKESCLTVLENSFFLNLGVLAAGTLYIRLAGGSQEVLVTISLGIAFLQFVTITAFHAYRFVIVPICKRCKKRLQGKSDSDSFNVATSTEIENGGKAITHSEVCLSELHKEATQISLLDLELQQCPENSVIPFNRNTPCSSTPRPSNDYEQQSGLQGDQCNKASSVKPPCSNEVCIKKAASESNLPLNLDAPWTITNPLIVNADSVDDSSDKLILVSESLSRPNTREHTDSQQDSISYSSPREPWIEIIQ